MLIQLQKSLVDSIRQLASLDKQQTPTSDLIGMIIGLVLGIILLIVFFIYLAYFFPWWLCYNKLCVKCFNLIYYIDCVLCYYTCPCMENKAHKYQIEQNKKNRNKCFVQDLLTTPDGCIIHLSDIRPISNEKRFGNKENNTRNKATIENE